MLQYIILSRCSDWIEYEDEIVSSIPDVCIFKIWDVLQKSLHYPIRTIFDIKLKAL